MVVLPEPVGPSSNIFIFNLIASARSSKSCLSSNVDGKMRIQRDNKTKHPERVRKVYMEVNQEDKDLCLEHGYTYPCPVCNGESDY